MKQVSSRFAHFSLCTDVKQNLVAVDGMYTDGDFNYHLYFNTGTRKQQLMVQELDVITSGSRSVFGDDDDARQVVDTVESPQADDNDDDGDELFGWHGTEDAVVTLF